MISERTEASQKSVTANFSLALCVLTFLAWLHPLNAYAIGSQEKIEGDLLDFSTDIQAILLGLGGTPNPRYGLPTGQCVVLGRLHTGLGIEAINYHGGSLGCWMFHEVNDSIEAGGWCSQWVIPGAINHCLATVKPSKVTVTNTNFVYCHKPGCALWDMWASGGNGALGFRIKRSFSRYGRYSTIQNETNISHFLVHGSDTSLWWKVCAFNEYGETCSAPTHTRAECGIPRGDDPPTQPY